MLTQTQQKRYSRNIALSEIGVAGQMHLLDAKILVIGAGGLGSPVILYLSAAGVGTIGIIDSDRVELSNLQRQILYGSSLLGKSKASAAATRINDLNTDVNIISYKEFFNAKNASKIIEGYDIIADCSDNFTTRYLINDTCFALKKTLVSAAIIGFTGQIATFKAYLGKNYPCYRCFCPSQPHENLLPNCLTGGVLGSIAGVIGSMQATEIIKEILSIGSSLDSAIIIYDGLKANTRKVALKKNPACLTCCP